MEAIFAILFIAVLGFFLFYFSIKEVKWYFTGEKQKEGFRLKVREQLQNENLNIVWMMESKKDDEKNPFKNSKGIMLPGFFGAGQKYFYWTIMCKNEENVEKIYWVEVMQSLFYKTRITFNPSLEWIG